MRTILNTTRDLPDAMRKCDQTLDRLPLSDIISVDEVHVELDEHCKYALVIQDFHTGDPIDLLRSRRVEVTEPYFVSIPREERNAVRYLITDMYNPYIRFVEKYFPNAAPVVDSFHVIQWIIHSTDKYIRQLIKKYKQRDRELYEARWHPDEMPAYIPPGGFPSQVIVLKFAILSYTDSCKSSKYGLPNDIQHLAFVADNDTTLRHSVYAHNGFRTEYGFFFS